jgi:hypothetical protein
MNRVALALVLGVALTSLCASLQAQEPAHAPGGAERMEAAERFDRGLRLFNAGDSSGALAEFRRAYEIIPNLLVLYNIGLVYAQMGRAVEATDALDQVLASSGSLSAERLAIAKRTREEQAARIADISVTTSVEGSAIEVDGVERGKTPLTGPLRVTSGTHVVGAIAPGFVPLRREVTIASGEKQAMQFDLVAMQGRLAHVVVKTHLPGADVFADDQHVGTTPLATSVSLAPGNHRIELRRSGYTSAHTDLVLGDGASGEVALELGEDTSAIGSLGGRLALDVSETQAVVTVDGRSRGVYVSPLRLAPGPHHLLVERGDFEPFERDVVVPTGSTVNVHVQLEPTPEYRAHYASRVRSQKTWGLVGIVGGAVLAGAGAGLAIYDATQRSSGQSTINSLNAQSTKGSHEVCDPGLVGTPQYQQDCFVPFTAATNQVNNANTRDYFAWSGVGVGAVAAALGIVLLVTADPHPFDQPKSVGTTVPSFWGTRGGGGFSETFVW